MSRSYKKIPIVKSGGDKNKKLANKVVRHIIDLNNSGCSRSLYKKQYNSWNINDYISRYTLEEATEDYNTKKLIFENNCDRGYLKSFFKKYPTLEDYIEKVWKKNYRRK